MTETGLSYQVSNKIKLDQKNKTALKQVPKCTVIFLNVKNYEINYSLT